ncbi:hypothetical protein [Legionella jordanis]|uniref:Uncharacterized protein n=1 Tax=Legionella jordanis TaxID=456 RepID=A0A0W0V8C6_9GAMM|nr:hypothetical protein [Legionella jordanis]KTD16385.1 hypothetical protein Ljor_0691 [Legionella jordanis]VEH12154.1 Uncharacterised protein [Legionella jordanis]
MPNKSKEKVWVYAETGVSFKHFFDPKELINPKFKNGAIYKGELLLDNNEIVPLN